jgi:hypothetical protein
MSANIRKKPNDENDGSSSGVRETTVVAAVESSSPSACQMNSAGRNGRHDDTADLQVQQLQQQQQHVLRQYHSQKTPKAMNRSRRTRKVDASLLQKQQQQPQLPSMLLPSTDTCSLVDEPGGRGSSSSVVGLVVENLVTPPASSPLRTPAPNNNTNSSKNSNDSKSNAPASKSNQHLLELFTPPPPPPSLQERQLDIDKRDEFSFLRDSQRNREDSPLIMTSDMSLSKNQSSYTSPLPAVVHEIIPIDESNRMNSKREKRNQAAVARRASWMRALLADLLRPTTWIGAFMFLLYHVVFSLTMGAAIMRPSAHHAPSDGGGGNIGGGSSSISSAPIFGIMTKMSANGVLFSAVVYWWSLSDDVPALYPAVDLFCAPFLADLAVIVDETLSADENVKPEENDAVFLATFTFLVCLGLTISATMLMLSSVFKLANLGAFLPSPVLSGFFSAIAVLMWALAVKVDTGGVSIGHILFSGDWNLMLFALKHHIPSVVVGSIMKVLSPMSPFFSMGCIFGVIISFYVYMAIAHVGLHEMVEAGWFWSMDQLINTKKETTGGWRCVDVWQPPEPAGWINYLVQGKVHWGAVQAGLSSAIALASLYMIRCSLHGAALRKNIAIMTRYVTVDSNATDQGYDSEANNVGEQMTNINAELSPPRRLQRQLSETVDLNAALMSLSIGKMGDNKHDDEATNGRKVIAVQSQPTKHTLTEILAQYAISQWVCSLVGGFAVVPSIGPSATMYTASGIR